MVSLSTQEASLSGSSNSGGSETQNFCYDEQNQLVWAGNSGTQPAAGNGTCGTATLSNTFGGNAYNTSFAYTHLGQLWQGPISGSGNSLQYLYCDSQHPHQLTGVYPMGTSCSSLTGTNYYASYDAWGNMVTRTANAVTSTLSFDSLDQLTQWSASSTDQEQNAYDANGNRVLQRSTTSAGKTITVYAFGLEEHVYDGSGNHQSDTFYYSLNSRLLGALTTTGTQFYLTDALGSVLSTISDVASSAAVLGNQLYGPYGNQRYNAGTMGTQKGFTGQYADSLSGLDYYNARYYDPVVGRFISVDTVDGNQQGMDPYAYVGGNPETKTDPTGHDWVDAIPFIAAAADVVVDAVATVATAAVAVAASPVVVAVLVVAAIAIAAAIVYNAAVEQSTQNAKKGNGPDPTPTPRPVPPVIPVPSSTSTAQPATDGAGAQCGTTSNCLNVRKYIDSYHQSNSRGGGQGGKSGMDLQGATAQQVLDMAIPAKANSPHLVAYYGKALYEFKFTREYTTQVGGQTITTTEYHGFKVNPQDLAAELRNFVDQATLRRLVQQFGAPPQWLKGSKNYKYY